MTDYARAVELALALLGSIARDGAGSAGALGRRLGLERKAMQRLLEPLDRRGFVRRDTDGEYVLGAALFERAGARPLPMAELVRIQLEEVRRLGYAISLDELQQGACGLAAPVRDDAGQVVGSIGVVGPLERFPPATYLAPAVYEAAATVCMAPGWRQRRPDPAGPLLRVT